LAWKTIMANSTVTLLRRVKTEAGWRYYPAAYAANGKVKPNVVLVNGQEVKHKTGFYGLRYYEGCQDKSRECEKWFLHKFRATFCTKLLRSGLDIRTIQAVMGHADLASTMRYLRPAENEQTQARINSMRWT
jgi:integrase